ncbi:nucleotidyltransferase family protein [Tenacibaculum jejuense]|uniref:Nucleotidyltransferase family protein n=1 Tax=Tenacibaculum jejuense TaxID=584609 RepID=A0A238UDM3_9FLAO|nr:nucleotidyltransferase family protein [Tenacibaculum jejuense]SNR16678.1 Protein of unknown function [Tenacibaculum jejuense]
MMTYKETLFFVGKCLTINHEEHNKHIVEKQLKNNTVDWDNVVRLSTEHYVFPALYCNLKKADFLKYLPNDLVEYMKHITDLNRERNTQIIEQAKEINELLLSHNITPIFLKGTGNLLEGLYDDIAERMVGDIDVLFSLDQFLEAYDTLLNNSYKTKYKNYPKFLRHLAPLVNENKISRIEIHKEMTTEKYIHFFNYDTIEKEIKKIENLNFLSFEDQLKLSIIAFQINDDMQYYNSISLRNAYDVFLICQEVNSTESIGSLNDKIRTPLNNFLSITNKTLNSKSVKFSSDKNSQKYLDKFIQLLDDKKLKKRLHKQTTRKLFYKKRLKIILETFYKKGHATWLINRIIKGK